MKNRIAFGGSDGKESYFCESYKKFLDYSLPRFMQIAATLSAGSTIRPQPYNMAGSEEIA